MANEIQKQEAERQGQASLPTLHPVEMKLRATYFGAGMVPMTALFDYMTQGQLGESAILGAIAGTTLAYFTPEIHSAIGPGLRLAGHFWAYLNRNHSGRAKHRLLDKEWWLTGESAVQYAEEEEEQAKLEEAEPSEPQDTPTAQPSAIPGQFKLGSQTLAAIKQVNEKRFVYFGKTATREVVLNIDGMYHVLDVAKSGRGKSNRFRHGMMQVVNLADTYYLNPFAAPVKSVTDERKIEVWQPIYDRLANGHPVRESAEFLQVLTSLVHEIEVRSDLEQQRDFSWREQPVFVFIDELPEIFARCPEAVALVDRIGRGGRQFGIFAWVASQTAQVKDLGLSTACQAQFKTLIYGGGDKVSSNRIMGSVSPEQEKALKTHGAGLTLMIADGLDDTEYVRAPLVTNEAMFTYFGLPPFQIEEWLAPAKSKQPVQDLSLFHSFTPDGKQAQNTDVRPRESRESERRERVKGPNEEAILGALNALEEECKPLTLNAITKKAELTWRNASEIEDVAYWFGYELDRGKGRPTKEG